MVAATKVNRPNTPRKPANGLSFSKKTVKPNASILSFFQKTQKQEESLFVGAIAETITQDEDIYNADERHRFNESNSPVKKRRLSDERQASTDGIDGIDTAPLSPRVENGTRDKKAKLRKNLPFIMDSDSEDEGEAKDVHKANGPQTPTKDDAAVPSSETLNAEPPETAHNPDTDTKVEVPSLKYEDSISAQFDELGEFAGLEDLGLDEFEGEETREMRFMREQARLEAEELGTLLGDDFGDDPPDDVAMTESCPICSGSLAGISPR